MLADLNIAFKSTLRIEGGYANNSRDKGGETYKGISRVMHPTWLGWTTIDAIKNKVGYLHVALINQEAASNISLQTSVKNFYKVNFWDELNLGNLDNQSIASELFDTGVNMGTSVAAKFFQRVLNAINNRGLLYPDLTLDGVIGAKTCSACNSLSKNDKYMVWKLLNSLQGERYISIVEHDPSQEIFMRSWASRVFEAA